MKFKNGFTLAEVLITLTVIGILLAVLMQTLKLVIPNKEHIMVKKAYNVAARIVNELVNDEDFYPETMDDTKQNLANTEKITYKGVDYGATANQKFCELFTRTINVNGDVNCALNKTIKTQIFKPGEATEGSFITTDGMVWYIPPTTFTNPASIYVDVNGDNDGNCFYTDTDCSLPDRFEFQITAQGHMSITDDLGKYYLNNTKTNKEFKTIKDSL